MSTMTGNPDLEPPQEPHALPSGWDRKATLAEAAAENARPNAPQSTGLSGPRCCREQSCCESSLGAVWLASPESTRAECGFENPVLLQSPRQNVPPAVLIILFLAGFMLL